MSQLRLNGHQVIELRNRLAAAFSNETFEELLLRIDRKIYDFAGRNDSLPVTILKSVQFADRELWWRDLLREACNTSSDPNLRTFADKVGFSPDFVWSDKDGAKPIKGRSLELKIEDSGTTFDIATWRTRLAEIEGRVCRIEFPSGTARGTGFLIGPGLVMTNYHVIQPAHEGSVGFNEVICRFDYKVLADGVSVGPGKEVGLVAEWLVDFSPYSDLDFEAAPPIDAPADKLDYAILRLSKRAGDDPVGSSRDPRGWIKLTPTEHDFTKDRAINIVQHPDGRPMQVALSSAAVIMTTPTRVRYTTTTQPGSSGSPCFSADWQWIALHHSGDPRYSKYGETPEYNQGIPVNAILALLTQRGKSQILKEPVGLAIAEPGLQPLINEPIPADPGGEENIHAPTPIAPDKPAARPSRKRRFSAGASDNSLETINKWLEDRLGRNTRDQQDTAELRSDFIEDVVAQIRGALGIDTARLVTVRSAFRKAQEYLRPVYTDPARLTGYFEIPSNQSPFSFAVDAELSLPFGNLQCVHADKSETGMFSALHKVKPFDAKQTDNSDDPERAFAPRIEKFWTDLIGKHRDMNSSGQICCFFAGRNKDGLNSGERIELQDLVAIYFVAPTDFFSDPDRLATRVQIAGKFAEQLFTGIKLISRIDSSLFKLEGLQIVAKLLPEFSKSDVALADKIAMAIERFKSHLGRHLVGRQQDGQAPNVFYLSASFEQTDLGFFPRLEMYPHTYRIDHVIGSFQVAHRWIPSATKLLLYRYLTSVPHQIVFGRHEGRTPSHQTAQQQVKVSEEFGSRFTAETLGTLPVEGWIGRIWDAGSPDILHMVSYDKTWQPTEGRKSPWKALNRPADPKKESNSIVAFIVEGELLSGEGGRPRRTLPRGIFAIESQHIDAFSDSDIEGLREVFAGLAALVRQSTHRNSPLDYRNNVADAFKRELPSESQWVGSDDAGTELATRFIFAVQKLDGKELENLCREIEVLVAGRDEEAPGSALAEYGLCAASFRQIQEIKAFCEGYADSSVDDKRAAQLMDQRKRSAQEWLVRRPSAPTDADRRTVAFLEAVTENFAWSGFLSSLSQALSDRVNLKIPEFRFMAGGYSAARMFMASLQGELRQVVKLSTKEKLNRERNNYVDQVRYRVVNAARIPVNGFAFDTQGQVGRGRPDGESGIPYGALVSDLVSGRRTSIVTLLSAVADTILSSASQTAAPSPSERSLPTSSEEDVSIEKMATALDKLFRTGMIHWHEANPPIQGGATSLHLARQAFRLPKRWIRPGSDEDEAALIRRGDLDNARDRFGLVVGDVGKDLLRDAWEMKRGSLLFEEKVIGPQSLKPATVHGDLNSRNLTWSSELESFFMIDFEHVAQSFFGVDQFRLLVNLVNEIFEAASTSGREEAEIRRLLNEIDLAVKYLWSIARALFIGPPHKGLGQIANDIRLKTFHESQLCSIINTLLGCVELDRRAEHTVERNRFWSYVLFCAALKEFEYSCRTTDGELVKKILSQGGGKDIYALDAAAIRGLIESALELNHNSDPVAFSNYFRHFTAARLLRGTIEPAPLRVSYAKVVNPKSRKSKDRGNKGRNNKSRNNKSRPR